MNRKTHRRALLASAAACFALVVVLAIIVGVFSALPMKGDYYNCGTIFSAQKSWTYKSTYDADSYFDDASVSDPKDSVLAAIEGLRADGNRASNAVAACQSEHDDRRTLLIALGVPGALLLVAAAGCVVGARRRHEPDGPAAQ